MKSFSHRSGQAQAGYMYAIRVPCLGFILSDYSQTMRFGLVVLTLAAIASASDVAKLRRMMVDSRFVGIVS